MAERTIIGTAKCHDCGSEVEQRVNQGGKVYWRCDGTLGPGCGAQHTHGPGTSRTMLKATESPSPAPAPKPAPKAPPPQPAKVPPKPSAPPAKKEPVAEGRSVDRNSWGW